MTSPRTDHRTRPSARLRPLRLGLGAAALACAMLLGAPAVQAAGPGAMDRFQSEHEATIALVKAKASASSVQKRVDGLLDYAWLSRAALGGPERFEATCADKCAAFEAKLTELIRKNYLRMIRQGKDHPVSYVGEVEGRNEVYKVSTEIRVKKHGREQVVKVEYVMHRREGKLSVRDIITDGVSLAKTYRYEFSEMAKKGGIDAILTSLDKKLAEDS